MDVILRHPIVDTGLLFDFLLCRFAVAANSPQVLQNGVRYLAPKHYRDALEWYFMVARPIVTCPHVIAELHGHAEKRSRGRYLSRFWELARVELVQLGLQEETTALQAMDTDVLALLGPTDASLLHVALRFRELSRPVLTEDGKLAGQCQKKNVPVLRLADILNLWQQHTR